MIQAGDKVSYITSRETQRTIKGKLQISYKMSVREGVMIEYGENNSKVKAKNGKIVWAKTAMIRPVGQKNALTEALLNNK
jgi:hypothetical protein